MKSHVRRAVSGVVGRIHEDLRVDPTLRYILLVGAVLMGFWSWYRTPNFVRPDEFSRLLDAMVAANYVLADPSFGALREGVAHGPTFGASFYLAGLALVPGYLVALATGSLDTVVSANELVSRWAVWYAVPEWFWTSSLLVGRAVIVAFGVGCVYLTYRIGTRLRDRQTGRLGALLFVLCFSVLRSAHEFSEDIPALFFVLLAFALAFRHADTGERSSFLAGCVAAGIATAFKLTAGVAVVVLAAAHLLWAYSEHDASRDDGTAASRDEPTSASRDDETVPSWDEGTGTSHADGKVRSWLTHLDFHLVGIGSVLGVCALVVGFPSVLVSGIDPLVSRVFESAAEKTSATSQFSASIPTWRLIIGKYVGALGGTLAVAAGVAVVASLARLRKRGANATGTVLILVTLGVCLLVLSRWEWVRPHHLLPTFPLLAVLVAAAVARFDVRSPTLARVLVVVLVVTTGTYAAIGALGYTADTHDRATHWIAAELPENATMDVYTPYSTLAALPHDRPVGFYQSAALGPYERVRNDGWQPNDYRQWQHEFDERTPDYIQIYRVENTSIGAALRDEYTVIERFEAEWPLRGAAKAVYGPLAYPEFNPAGRLVVLERTDRCGTSPTCPHDPPVESANRSDG